ncbi:Ubiquitin carboxyl-terminal hydrolase 24 [Cardamine amara subsp. amara]|uniref:Ubiquitin carboxyl-terminal hydrolase n=1 Tax=Cardamine amara subsp. amara TaxID=228776 RepID=A0ABD1BFR1_CARAN
MVVTDYYVLLLFYFFFSVALYVPNMSEKKVIVFGSFTEHETRSLLEPKPIKVPQNHKDKSVGSIQFGSLNLVPENSSVNTNGELKKGQADGTVKSRPSSSHKENKIVQSSDSQKRLDASRPSSSDKVNDGDAKLPRKYSSGVPEHVGENGVMKEVSERKALNNGVAVKPDPIGLDKLCESDGESDSVYYSSSSKFQALDSENLSSDSFSGSIPRKKNQMVPTESLPPVKDFTPRGLINAGNLCFLNATLQALLSCSPFVQLLQGIQLQDIPKAESPTLAAFSEFISELDAPSTSSFRNNVAVVEAGRPFTPAMFEGVLRNFTPDVLNNMSGRPRQEDAQEFLSFIMDQMHDELLKLREQSPRVSASKSSVISSADDDDDDEWETVGPKNKSAVTRTQSFVPSELSDIFGGQLKSVVKAKGTKASATVQPYLLLHLDIHPEAVGTIENALHLFCAAEDLEGYRASVTGKADVVSARKSIKIQNLSKIMILHLMRFSYGSQGSTKLHKSIRFPLELNIGRHLLASPSNESLKYELVATITHHGRDPSKGHYTTDARRKNGQWLRFDDASVIAIGTKQVLHDQAYVLFYKQV